MAKTSLFRVGIQADQSAPPKEFLVRATKPQLAEAAAVQKTLGRIVTEVADPEDAFRLAKAGVEIIDATGEQQDPQTAGSASK